MLVQLADLMPLYMFNAYGASLAWIERDRPLLRDTVAAMIEANRTMYRDPAKAHRGDRRCDQEAEGRRRISPSTC